MTRFLACAACQKTEPFQVHAISDLTEWEVYPPGWLLYVRNGVIIPACSEACAEAYIEGTFGNRPVSKSSGAKSPGLSLESRLGERPCKCGRQGRDGILVHAIGCPLS